MTDEKQFEVFMHSYQNMVFSTAMRLLADQAQAEDVAQEVFLKAFERFEQLRDNPAAGGWLKAVARNLSLNHLSRYRSRWSFFSEIFAARTGGETENAEMEFAAPEMIEEELNRSDRQELVEQALRQLPFAQRVPLVLFHLEGLTYEEIAVQLGVSLGKIKTDIFRGRAVLRKKLRPRLELEGGKTKSV